LLALLAGEPHLWADVPQAFRFVVNMMRSVAAMCAMRGRPMRQGLRMPGVKERMPTPKLEIGASGIAEAHPSPVWPPFKGQVGLCTLPEG